MLEVRIHDKHQLEFKSHYRLKQQEKHTSYAIEIYMFVPNSLDLGHTLPAMESEAKAGSPQ